MAFHRISNLRVVNIVISSTFRPLWPSYRTKIGPKLADWEFSQRLLDKRVTALLISTAKTTQYCIFKLVGSGNVIHDQTDTGLTGQEAPDPLQENGETQAAS